MPHFDPGSLQEGHANSYSWKYLAPVSQTSEIMGDSWRLSSAAVTLMLLSTMLGIASLPFPGVEAKAVAVDIPKARKYTPIFNFDDASTGYCFPDDKRNAVSCQHIQLYMQGLATALRKGFVVFFCVTNLVIYHAHPCQDAKCADFKPSVSQIMPHANN